MSKTNHVKGAALTALIAQEDKIDAMLQGGLKEKK